jgi:hypothetical protein
MARSRLLNPTSDLISDGGTVLFSLVQGEQIEYPVTLDFLRSVAVTTNNYTFEAVVVEGSNTETQASAPTTARPGGVKTTLFVRLPYYLGNWTSQYAYNKEEVVKYAEKYYKLVSGAGYLSTTTPDADPNWEETVLNKLYVQFPASLARDWAVKPSPNAPGYGFFEIRVTEPTDSIFSRTLKPVRGLVEILYSPSEDTPDVSAQST